MMASDSSRAMHIALGDLQVVLGLIWRHLIWVRQKSAGGGRHLTGASGDPDAKGKHATPSGLVSRVRLTTWVGEVVLALLLKTTNRL